MALQVADGTITLTTGAIGTTFTVSGLAFQPVAIRCFWSGRATSGQAEQDHKFGIGFASSTTARRCVTSQSDHAAATMVCGVASYDDCVIATLTAANALDGKADLDAITSDGFRLIIDDVFSAGLQVGWYAIGGDVTNAEIVTFSAPGVTGNQDITSFSFTPDAVMFLAGFVGTVNTISTLSSSTIIGAASFLPSLSQAVLAGANQAGQASSVASSYCRMGEVLAQITWSDAVTDRASVTAQLANGFRLNWAEASGGVPIIFALGLKGGKYAVGNFLTAQDGNTYEEVVGFDPSGMLFFSHNKPESQVDMVQSDDERMMGCATSTSSRRVASIIDKNALATADIGVSYQEDCFYTNQSNAATVVTEAKGDLLGLSVVGGGFSWYMPDPDVGFAFCWYLAVGTATAQIRIYEDSERRLKTTRDLALGIGALCTVDSVDLARWEVSVPNWETAQDEMRAAYNTVQFN
jgi:hypothetical protein